MNILAKAETLFEKAGPASPEADAITVAVSLYNYATYLPECLDSVASQRHKNIHLIIVDDASQKDNSADVAREWLEVHSERFERAILLKHTKNQGLAQVRNTAFSHSNSDFVFVIDADNAIYPRAIERLFKCLKETNHDAAYTQLEFFGDEQRLGYADVWRKKYFQHGNYVDAMALISKKSWEGVGGYTHIEGGWEDYDFWCKFIDSGYSAIFVPEILCRYRVHKSSMLRTETLSSYSSIGIEMSIRHPWLRL